MAVKCQMVYTPTSDGAVPDPGKAVLGPGEASLGQAEAALGPDQTVVGPGETVLSPDQAVLGPDDAALSPDKTVLGPDDAALSPGEVGRHANGHDEKEGEAAEPVGSSRQQRPLVALAVLLQDVLHLAVFVVRVQHLVILRGVVLQEHGEDQSAVVATMELH